MVEMELQMSLDVRKLVFKGLRTTQGQVHAILNLLKKSLEANWLAEHFISFFANSLMN